MLYRNALLALLAALLATYSVSAETPVESVEPTDTVIAQTKTKTEPDSAPIAETASAPEAEVPAQTDNTPLPSQAVIDYLDAIETEEALRGAFDPHMSEMFHGLAYAHQKQGNHKEAVDAFKHSMHVNRVNNGIYSITQEPMIRGMIESNKAMLKMDKVAFNYNQLLRLYERSYGRISPEMIPLLIEASVFHRDTYLEWQTQERVGHLILAHSMSGSAVDIATKHFGYTNLQLIGLLRDMAKSSYYLALHYGRYQSLDTPDDSGFFAAGFERHPGSTSSATQINNEERLRINSYNSGRNAYERIVAILNNNDATPRQRAEAFVELGDWFTLFKRRTPAMEAYLNAWNILEAAKDIKSQKELLGSPVMLPMFESENNIKQLPEGEQSYVKATMQIGTSGIPRYVDIVETYPKSEKLARTANRIIRNSKFRIRFENGEPVKTDDYELKLYITD